MFVYFYIILHYLFIFKLAYNTKLNWLVVCLLPVLGETPPFYKSKYPVGKTFPHPANCHPTSSARHLPSDPFLIHTTRHAHTWILTSFFLKAKALNTVILFTDRATRMTRRQTRVTGATTKTKTKQETGKPRQQS